jgi:hypothetical protein
MLQALTLTACSALSRKLTVSRFTMRNEPSRREYLSPGAHSQVSLPTLVYAGLGLCLG